MRIVSFHTKFSNDAFIAQIKEYLISVWIFCLATKITYGYDEMMMTEELGLKGMSKNQILEKACDTLYAFFPLLGRTGCRTLLQKHKRAFVTDSRISQDHMLQYFHGVRRLIKEWLTEIKNWKERQTNNNAFHVDAVITMQHEGLQAAMVGFWYRNSSHSEEARERLEDNFWQAHPDKDPTNRKAVIEMRRHVFDQLNYPRCSPYPNFDEEDTKEASFEMRRILVHPAMTLSRIIIREGPALSGVLSAEVTGKSLAIAAERLALILSQDRPTDLHVHPFGKLWQKTLYDLGFRPIDPNLTSSIKLSTHGIGTDMKKRVTSPAPKVSENIVVYLTCPWHGYARLGA